jgi:hypothetical protein
MAARPRELSMNRLIVERLMVDGFPLNVER